MDERDCINTDKEIWWKVKADYYSPRIYVTKQNGITFCVGGNCVTKSIEDWFALATPTFSGGEKLNESQLIELLTYYFGLPDKEGICESGFRNYCSILNCVKRILKNKSLTKEENIILTKPEEITSEAADTLNFIRGRKEPTEQKECICDKCVEVCKDTHHRRTECTLFKPIPAEKKGCEHEDLIYKYLGGDDDGYGGKTEPETWKEAYEEQIRYDSWAMKTMKEACEKIKAHPEWTYGENAYPSPYERAIVAGCGLAVKQLQEELARLKEPKPKDRIKKLDDYHYHIVDDKGFVLWNKVNEIIRYINKES